VKHTTILINGDLQREGNETFYLVLFQPKNARIVDSVGLGTIHNDD